MNQKRIVLLLPVMCLITFGWPYSFTLAQKENSWTASSQTIMVFNQPKYVAGDTAFFALYWKTKGKILSAGNDVIDLDLVSSSGASVVETRVKLNEGISIGQLIMPSELTPGVYYLVAQTLNNLVGNQALGYIEFYLSGSNLLFDKANSDLQTEGDCGVMHISAEKLTFKPREEVKLKFSWDPSAVYNKSVFFSVMVYKEDLFKDVSGNNLSTVRHLKDDLSLIQVKWSMDFPRQSGLPTNIFFRGRLIQGTTKSPIEKPAKILFYLNRNDFTYQVYSKPGGWFEFPLFRDFGDEVIFYKIYQNNVAAENARLLLESESFSLPANKDSASDRRDDYFTYATKRNMINQSYNFYQNKNKNSRVSLSDLEFLECDHEVSLAKFEDFITMNDVFINVIPNVKIRADKKGDELRVFLGKTATYGKQNPIFIVNGIMTDSTNFILGLDPRRVNRIGVIRTEGKLLRFGKLGENGIIVIEMNSRELLEEVAKTSLRINGIAKPIQYRLPRYIGKSASSKIPDLRSSIYWNPSIKTSSNEADIQFFASDDLGTYVVEIFGVSEDGTEFTCRKQINITNQPN